MLVLRLYKVCLVNRWKSLGKVLWMRVKVPENVCECCHYSDKDEGYF